MGFKADHEAIRQFGRTVGDLTDDADRANSYARDHLGIGYKKGRMFFTVVEKATEVRDALTDNYRRLARIVDGSADELAKAADLYRDTDATAAARADGAYSPTASDHGGTR
jgi:hypothetical protein